MDIRTSTSHDIAWAASQVGIECFRSDAVGLTIHDADSVKAVVVYDNFSAYDCNMHVASDGSRRWLTRDILVALFMMPFKDWNLRRVTGLVRPDNEAALRFDLKLGFKIEGRARDATADGDLMLLGMTRRECHLIPMEYRK